MHSFLWLSNIPLCICTTMSIQSSVDGYLGCFHVLAVLKSAAVNNGVHVFFSTLVSSVCVPRSGIAGSYGGLIPRFLRYLHTVFHNGCINLHFHQQFKTVPLSTLSPGFIVCRLFDDGHSDQREVIAHCGFDLHFSNNEWCWVSFHVFHIYIFLVCLSGEVSCTFSYSTILIDLLKL